MPDKKELKAYYKRRQKKGKLPLAQAVDYVTVRLVALVAFYLWFRSIMPGRSLAWLMTLVAFSIFLLAARLWRMESRDRFIQKERKEIAKRILRERLLFLPRQELLELVRRLRPEGVDGNSALYCLRKADKADADDVLRAYEAACRVQSEGLLLCACCELEPAAHALCKRLPMKVDVVSQKELLACMEKQENAVQDAQIDAYIQTEISAQKQERGKIWQGAISGARAGKYAATAAILFAASFLSGYSLYYRVMAITCLMLAGVCLWLRRGTLPLQES